MNIHGQKFGGDWTEKKLRCIQKMFHYISSASLRETQKVHQ